MQAIVLAAGAGTRLGRGPKALVPLLGLTLAERCVLTLWRAGVSEFVLVVGAGDKDAHRTVVERLTRRGIPISLVRNEAWRRGNALSVLAARPLARERFLVAMADHVFEPELARLLMATPGPCSMIVDRDPRFVDAAEATRVRVVSGSVVEARKNLVPYDGVDAGLFACDHRVFAEIEEAAQEEVESWSEVAARMQPVAIWSSGSFWIDVDTGEDFARAERLLLMRLGKPEDGLVSRYLNRPLSRRISRHLVAMRLGVDAITVLAFLPAVAAGIAFAVASSWAILALAGVLAQLASVLDGVDGEIARLRFEESSRGAWLDAVLDRYADAIVLGGMAWGAAVSSGLAWPAGVAAVSGAMAVSYSAARYEAAFLKPGPWNRRAIPAKRDTRYLLILVGGVLNVPLAALLTIAALSHAEVLRRMIVSARPPAGARRSDLPSERSNR